MGSFIQVGEKEKEKENKKGKMKMVDSEKENEFSRKFRKAHILRGKCYEAAVLRGKF